MQEFGEGFAEDVFEDKKKMATADALCFVYDSSDMRSFAYILQVMTDVTTILFCDSISQLNQINSHIISRSFARRSLHFPVALWPRKGTWISLSRNASSNQTTFAKSLESRRRFSCLSRTLREPSIFTRC